MTRKDFDLATLEDKFNPAIVYCYEPEQCPEGRAADPQTIDYCLNITNQLDDIFAAYSYAQQDILPSIASGGRDNITPEMLVGWIKEVHSRIATQLAINQDMKAGEYAADPVILYKYGQETSLVLSHLTVNKDISGSKAVELLELCGMTKVKARKVAELYMRYAQDESRDWEFSEDYAEQPNKNNPKIASIRIYHAYHRNRLSADELAIVRDFVKFNLPLKAIPMAIQAYAIKLTDAWNKCDATNLSDVCDLAYQAFYGLIDIHPFFNGNGRTATCIMNTILVSLRLPSVVMPAPSEQDDETSAYSLAIKHIESDPTLFKKLIHDRIQAALAGDAYHHQNLSSIIPLKMKLGVLVKRLQNTSTSIEVADRIYQEKTHKINQIASRSAARWQSSHDNAPGRNLITLEATRLLVAEFEAYFSNRATLPVSVAYQYSSNEMNEVAAQLNRITNMPHAWNVYAKDQSCFATCDMPNAADAKALMAQLEALGVEGVRLQDRNDTKQPVVYIAVINLGKLKALTVAEKMPQKTSQLQM